MEDPRWELRQATRDDQPGCERLIREAFWDVYRPGCHEHYLWHRAMQGHPDLVDELTLVLCADGLVVGCVMSTRARVVRGPGPGADAASVEVLALGPVGVRPAWQGRGAGSRLIMASLSRARAAGVPAVFLCGAPGYYGRFGFEDAVRWGISTAEGDNFPAFMATELRDGGLAGVSGRLLESDLFEVDEGLVRGFDAGFSGGI